MHISFPTTAATSPSFLTLGMQSSVSLDTQLIYFLTEQGSSSSRGVKGQGP
jgi:hypothetical protein